MLPGKYYHITTRANGFEDLFHISENYRYFLSRYEHFIPPVARTLAYCLLPNQIQLLVRIRSEKEVASTFGPQKTLHSFELRISKQFSNLFSSYTHSLNHALKRRGSLFVPNFERIIVGGKDQFRTRVLLIHMFPVELGMVRSLADWTWSSYNDVMEGNSFLDVAEMVRQTGGRMNFLR